jgi:hypothetical protein
MSTLQWTADHPDLTPCSKTTQLRICREATYRLTSKAKNELLSQKNSLFYNVFFCAAA